MCAKKYFPSPFIVSKFFYVFCELLGAYAANPYFRILEQDGKCFLAITYGAYKPPLFLPKEPKMELENQKETSY